MSSTNTNSDTFRRWALVISTLLSLAYCQSALAGGRPSHETALAQIRRALPDNYAVTVTDLKYVNGYALDAGRYVAVVTYKLNMKISSEKSNQSFNKDLKSGINAFGELTLIMMFGHFEPGDSFDEAQEYIFLDTENGWILQGPKGDAQVTARHTPNADAAEHEAEEAKKASQEAGRRSQQEFYKKQQAMLDSIKQACAAGQQMHVSTGPLHLQDMQGGGTLDQWVYAGQVVTSIPGENRPYMCHVQYTSRGRLISGYIGLNQLTLN
jgi:hypothetical protein